MATIPLSREELVVFDLVNGLPIHPLVVHAVVVLIPLAAIGAIAIALKPAWRRSYGPLVVACAVLAAILCPIATSSGEALERHVGDPGQHADLGDQLIWFVLPLAIFTLALVLLDRRQRAAVSNPVPAAVPVGVPAGRPVGGTAAAAHGSTEAAAPASASGTPSPSVVKVVAALAVLAGLATTFQAYRVGESGARAAWGDQVSSSSGSGSAESGS
jgi:uncharacterized membrane protein